VEVRAGDMGRPETLGPALDGVERAMLISSSDMYMADVQTAFIDAAAKADVGHIAKLSGIMPALDSPFRFARMHAEIERHLEASGIAYTHLRAGEFMQAYFRQVPVITARHAIAVPLGDQRIASIDALDIAEVAARVLATAGHEGHAYPITGPEALTMTEVAAILSEVTGTTIRYIDATPEQAREAWLAAGVPPYNADALTELYAERRQGKESHVSPGTASLLGRPPTSFAQFARRHAAVFRGEPQSGLSGPRHPR
jgi:uncharacterized protein YbjT (DUF2867 family)